MLSVENEVNNTSKIDHSCTVKEDNLSNPDDLILSNNSSRKIKGSHGYGLSFNRFQTQAMQKRVSAFKTRALTAYK